MKHYNPLYEGINLMIKYVKKNVSQKSKIFCE